MPVGGRPPFLESSGRAEAREAGGWRLVEEQARMLDSLNTRSAGVRGRARAFVRDAEG